MANNNFLEHYGIPGMHWGRKKGNVVVTTNASEDHNKKVALKGKKLHEMTNDELRTYTQRMQLERSYKDLSKTEISAGKKFVNSVINSATKGASDAAMAYVNKRAAKMVEDMIKKATKVP